MNETVTPLPCASIEAGFLLALPRVVAHARVVFRSVRCPGRREECVAETIAIVWHWYRRLWERGKDPSGFISALAIFAARQVRCGRRLCGQEPGKDVLSPLAQSRHRFTAQALVDDPCPALESLRENTRSPVPIQAAFRLDFPRWLASLGDTKRRLAEALLAGEQAKDVARLLGLTPGRVSQIRSELRRDWHRFHGEWT
jgi:hypothetical protein